MLHIVCRYTYTKHETAVHDNINKHYIKLICSVDDILEEKLIVFNR